MTLTPYHQPADESPYRENLMVTLLTTEEMRDYRNLREETQVHVAHLVVKGIPFTDAVRLAKKEE